MPASQAPALRVIVTRPEREAWSWVQQLGQNGFDAQALPLIEIAPVALGSAMAGAEQFDAFMFVSVNAVDHFLRALPPGVLRGQRFMTPGPGTATALLTHGIAAGQIDVPPAQAPQFDSEALWQLVGHRQWSGLKVLIVRGANHADVASRGSGEGVGRDWFAHKLREAGARVEFRSVYERRAPALTLSQLERARQSATDSSVWIFSSSEAVLNLTGPKGMPCVDWSRALAIATHPRIAETVRAAGWGVVVESRPALADIVTTLRSIESGHP